MRARVDDSRGSGSGRDGKRCKVKGSEDCDEGDAVEDFSYEFGPGSFERTARLTQKAVKERLSSVLGTEFELRFSGAAYPSLVNRQVLFSRLPQERLGRNNA